MDIIIFMALGAALGFLGGITIGRWAMKQDKLNRRAKPMNLAGVLKS